MEPTLYRIKKEARPFINEKYINSILPLCEWEKQGLSENALEEVEYPYVSFGVKNGNSTSLCGWSADDGARFEFTIHFPSMKVQEYDRLSKGFFISEMMDSILNEVQYKLSQIDIGDIK